MRHYTSSVATFPSDTTPLLSLHSPPTLPLLCRRIPLALHHLCSYISSCLDTYIVHSPSVESKAPPTTAMTCRPVHMRSIALELQRTNKARETACELGEPIFQEHARSRRLKVGRGTNLGRRALTDVMGSIPGWGGGSWQQGKLNKGVGNIIYSNQQWSYTCIAY
ncbi:hypothetical protein J6590_085696 [Homalodisca vitripennis]|nr:hypothetical protein J6590_085696 [Homalodisca vitripennis]